MRKRTHDLCQFNAVMPASKRNREDFRLAIPFSHELPVSNIPRSAKVPRKPYGGIFGNAMPKPFAKIVEPTPTCRMTTAFRRPSAPPVKFGAIKPKPGRKAGGLEDLCTTFTTSLKFTKNLAQVKPAKVHRPVARRLEKGKPIARLP
mmetsp:Transcript_13322/g.26071  ORF Transcript_13322/g.26071 Transcript_13322/m.26071 type:complete len:147 (-) Transcript_13322:458-898(-)